MMGTSPANAFPSSPENAANDGSSDFSSGRIALSACLDRREECLLPGVPETCCSAGSIVALRNVTNSRPAGESFFSASATLSTPVALVADGCCASFSLICSSLIFCKANATFSCAFATPCVASFTRCWASATRWFASATPCCA
jgi:hypothetical protein